MRTNQRTGLLLLKHPLAEPRMAVLAAATISYHSNKENEEGSVLGNATNSSANDDLFGGLGANLNYSDDYVPDFGASTIEWCISKATSFFFTTLATLVGTTFPARCTYLPCDTTHSVLALHWPRALALMRLRMFLMPGYSGIPVQAQEANEAKQDECGLRRPLRQVDCA